MEYPSSLPCPLRAGYDITPHNNIIRTEMVSGRARQRVAYTSIPAFAELSWLFTSQQAQLFESWSALVGAEWFTIKIKSPLGYYDHECRFTETVKGPKLAGREMWGYKATVEIRNRILIDSDYTEILPDYILLSDIFDIAMNREWLE